MTDSRISRLHPHPDVDPGTSTRKGFVTSLLNQAEAGIRFSRKQRYNPLPGFEAVGIENVDQRLISILLIHKLVGWQRRLRWRPWNLTCNPPAGPRVSLNPLRCLRKRLCFRRGRREVTGARWLPGVKVSARRTSEPVFHLGCRCHRQGFSNARRRAVRPTCRNWGWRRTGETLLCSKASSSAPSAPVQ